MTTAEVRPPAELLAEIREDLRHEGTPRCDRWFPEIAEGAEVLSLNLGVGLAWWTVALPIIKQARVGDRILVLDSPRPEVIGRVGTLRSFDGFPCVDLHDGTSVRPLIRRAALLPRPALSPAPTEPRALADAIWAEIQGEGEPDPTIWDRLVTQEGPERAGALWSAAAVLLGQDRAEAEERALRA